MKNFFLLGVLFNLVTINAYAMNKTDAMALAGVGLLSTSAYWAIQAFDKTSESWDTRDPYQKRALIQSRDFLLTGSALSGMSAVVLLGNGVAGNPHAKTKFMFAVCSSGMLAISASCLKLAKKYAERFNITGEEDVADLSKKLEQYAASAGLCGMIMCIPVVTEI